VNRSRPLFFLASFWLAAPLFAAQVAGVSNFHEIDPHVYRGAQPTAEGFRNLARMGIQVVIDLRGGQTRAMAEEKTVEADGMRYVHVPLNGFFAPSGADISRLLAILDSPDSGPVFVHCRRGADRTGTLIACYRISHDHWKNARALQEARHDGMSWLERSMQHFILTYKPPPGKPVVSDTAAVTQ
jgi:tyrosine-protein phosphatase SIW14